MKNAHLKTCNNLIFANIHRWYKIHTIKNVSDVVLRSWNKKNLAAIPDLLLLPSQGREKLAQQSQVMRTTMPKQKYRIENHLEHIFKKHFLKESHR